MGENNELRNRFMVINAPKDMGISTPTSPVILVRNIY